jgi:hypothetical protein
MTSRKQFLGLGSLGLFSLILPSLPAFSGNMSDFEGLVVNDQEGEAVRMRDGTAIVRIKI